MSPFGTDLPNTLDAAGAIALPKGPAADTVAKPPNELEVVWVSLFETELPKMADPDWKPELTKGLAPEDTPGKAPIELEVG